MDINDIGNLQDSPRFVFIDEECENLIVVNDGWKLTRNINQKKRSGVSQLFINVHHVANAVGESVSSETMWNIVNQLGKHDFSCEAVANNLEDRKLFLIQWTEIVLSQFLQGATGIVPPCRSKMPWLCCEENNFLKLWSNKAIFNCVFLSCYIPILEWIYTL